MTETVAVRATRRGKAKQLQCESECEGGGGRVVCAREAERGSYSSRAVAQAVHGFRTMPIASLQWMNKLSIASTLRRNKQSHHDANRDRHFSPSSTPMHSAIITAIQRDRPVPSRRSYDRGSPALGRPRNSSSLFLPPMPLPGIHLEPRPRGCHFSSPPPLFHHSHSLADPSFNPRSLVHGFHSVV